MQQGNTIRVQALVATRSLIRRGGVATMAAFIAAAMLDGCAIPPPSAEQDRNPEQAVPVNADSALAAGRRDMAVELLESAAKQQPGSAGPWLKIAEIRFDAGLYPEAIVAASQAVRRDPASQAAKGILVVAGLRVAAAAVTGLRANGKVDTSSRVEAEKLTTALRRMLGETVLVPAPAAPRERPKPRPLRARLHPPLVHSPVPLTADPFAALK